MIGYLSGVVLCIEPPWMIVDVAGVGYQVYVPKNIYVSAKPNETIKLFICTHVKDDAIELFGFTGLQEKNLFLLLCSVSGVGKKTALSFLSLGNVESIVTAIVNGDIEYLSSPQGVGKKTAQRIHLELKEKALKIPVATSNAPGKIDKLQNLVQAILGLGFKKEQGEQAVKSFSKEELEQLPLEHLLRKSINHLSRVKPQ